MELPKHSCHGAFPDARNSLEPSLSRTVPPGGTRGVVLLSSRVWKDVNRLDTRDWNLMPYSSLVITGGQKHTHIY